MKTETPSQPLKVVQDNALITASYRITLDEKRLLVACIGKLDPTQHLWKLGRATVDLSATEWAKLYDISSSNAYDQLNQASIKLYDRSVRITGDSKKGKDIRWLQARSYDVGEGRVQLVFSGEILFYLTGMIDQFTKYDILGVAGLKSVHSVRIYELSRQFISTGWRVIQIEDLKRMLQIEESYSKWSELKRWVIDKSINEINEKSDILLKYETIKTGKKITAIKLLIENRKQLDFGGLEW